MSEKQVVSKWNNPKFLHSLMVALYGQLKGNLTKEARDAIEEKMHSDGFEDTTWDGIRLRDLHAAPAGKWANPALLEALMMGFYGIAKGEGLSKEAKDSIIAKVHLWGFTDITWEGIRCAFRR
ncbi:hypothetical protein CTA2_3042 [Colletotrichum tanaceti]|uniref:Uncharacterized protein n=1 Tax=Colletotrichum tanaceti TaxID=1306861 RepID=A0A4U6X680_9PEZI|nr:hypothetical protein CTA2_3042 [Colletotrichum tanaceti]TKW50369.1 hypothetical protein CTA1_11214 [Colletotrichum tanaceti]